MVNTNNKVQTPMVKTTSTALVNTNSTSGVENREFSSLIDDSQENSEISKESTGLGSFNNNKTASRSSGVYGGQTTDRGTQIIQPGEDMNKDAFLRILAAQMSNQDPTQPQDGTEYVSQFAQFAAMEQMANLNDTMSEYTAQSLISKGVMLNVYDNNGNAITGVVRSVSQNGSKIVVGIEYMNENGEYVIGEFEKDDISNVIDTQDNRLDYINNNMAILVGSSMLDKNIEFIISNDENESVDEVDSLDNQSSSIDENELEELKSSNTEVLTSDDGVDLNELTPEERDLMRKSGGQDNFTTYETKTGKVESVVVENYTIKLKVLIDETGEMETVTLDKVIRVNGEEYTN